MLHREIRNGHTWLILCAAVGHRVVNTSVVASNASYMGAQKYELQYKIKENSCSIIKWHTDNIYYLHTNQKQEYTTSSSVLLSFLTTARVYV